MNVYDFDHTIYDGDSSLDFFFYALRRKPRLAALLPFQVWGCVKYLFGVIPKERMKEHFFVFLRFIPFTETVSAFWELNRRKIKSWYLEQKRDSDVVISASPECILEPLIRGYLGAALIASKVNPATGEYSGKNCFGEEKVSRFYAAHPKGAIENFYSDSLSDSPLAKKAEHAFVLKGKNIIPWDNYEPNLFEKMKKTYLTKDFIVFIFCGGMGTLTNFIFSLLISTALDPSVSYIFGYGISLFAAYALNAKLIFDRKISRAGFLKFVVSYIPNFLILFTFVLVFLNLLNWNKIIVYVLAGLLGLPVTFLFVKIFAFGRGKK